MGIVYFGDYGEELGSALLLSIFQPDGQHLKKLAKSTFPRKLAQGHPPYPICLI